MIDLEYFTEHSAFLALVITCLMIKDEFTLNVMHFGNILCVLCFLSHFNNNDKEFCFLVQIDYLGNKFQFWGLQFLIDFKFSSIKNAIYLLNVIYFLFVNV